jgi:ABC-type uncharacterized transport system substrate-binding protein
MQTVYVVGLVNPTNPNSERITAEVQEAARAKDVKLLVLKASNQTEIDASFAALLQQHGAAIVVDADAFFTSQRAQLVALASHYAVPAIYGWREFATSGGLMSYGTSLSAVYRLAGNYAGKILKGSVPADLPVEQPTQFEMVINLQTAKALGCQSTRPNGASNTARTGQRGEPSCAVYLDGPQKEGNECNQDLDRCNLPRLGFEAKKSMIKGSRICRIDKDNPRRSSNAFQ